MRFTALTGILRGRLRFATRVQGRGAVLCWGGALVSIAGMRRLIAVLILLLAPPLAALPETPLFHTLGPAQGLPSSKLSALAQDQDGYLWVGTADGLARYDGERFALWQHEPDRPGSLPANAVQSLLVDSRNRLWVGLQGEGLAVLDTRREEFQRPEFDAKPGGGLRDVWTIAEASDGAIWYGGYGGGLFRLDPVSGEIRRHLADADRADALPVNEVLSLAAADAGRLWVGTTQGLALWDGDSFERIPGLEGRLVLRIRLLPDGGLLLATSQGLLSLDAGGALSEPELAEGALPGQLITALQHDASGALWFGTTNGLYLLDQGRLQTHRANRRKPFTLGANAVMDLLVDHEGGLWIATEGGGLAHLPRDWRAFSIWVFAWDQPDSPGMLLARGISESADGRLWLIGGGGGLDRLDPADGRFERIFGRDAPLPERRAWSVLESDDGGVWIGHHRGLSRFDPESGETRHWWNDEGADDAPMPGPVDMLLADGEGGFWASIYGSGIERRNRAGELLLRVGSGPAQGLLDGIVEQMALGPDGALWAATVQGALRWSGSRFERLEGLPLVRASALGFDPQGRLWVHQTDALLAFDLSGGTARENLRFDSRHGLPAVPAGGLMPDRAGRIWLNTPRGLVRVEPQSGEVRLFGIRDGLPSIEFSDRPGLVTRGGLIVAGAMGALVAFDPDRLDTEVEMPRLRLERVALRRDGERQELDVGGSLQLRHDDREIQFLSRAVSFADPERQLYRFRLQGYEPDWVVQRGRGERVFSQLPPGRYRLQLQASDRLGRWLGEPLTVSVQVTPPWWQRPGSLLLFGLAAVALAWLALRSWRLRLQRQHARALANQQRQMALQASEAKTAFLQHLGHEVRTPMTGVLGMTELLQGTELAPAQRRYVEAIARSGEVMLRVVNDALDLARIEAGRLELAERAFDPAALLQEVGEPLRALAQAKGLAFTLEAVPDASPALIGDPLRVRQILLNLGNNAVKFTERGGVTLRRLQAGIESSFVIEVEDTGPGLDAQQRARLFQRFSQAEGAQTAARHGGSGLGLSISRELARLMGGDITLDSAPGRGSRFRVSLPLPTAEGPAEPARSVSPMPAGRTLNLLLVEDDAIVAATLAGLLETLGHRVTHSPHSLAALTELQSHPFDLALLDLDLPGMDGLALARLLRQRGETLPLLAITARADAEAEPDARAAGMQGFLRKPVSGVQLADALAALVPDGAG